ncbi:MAG: hypothetical protein CMK07_07250 [Ponticaulis sp.]|nr:hypothetical protein [Ponticaulis sp.]
MRHLIKALLLSTASTLVVSTASADTELEDRIAALEETVALLKAELAAEKADNDTDIVRLETKISETAPASSPAGEGFVVGGTTLKFGGYVDFDGHVTNLSDGAIGSSSIGRDFYIPGLIGIGGSETTTTDFTAQASRITLDGSRMVGDKKVTGYFEMDFLGSLQGDERVSSSFSPRLRRAYLDYNGWRVGQEWSTFQNTSAIPESASFLASSDGMIFMRQAQIRYTNGPWQFALENGNATITPVGGGRIEADANLVPDVVGRYNFTGGFGNVSLAAIGRQLRMEMPGVEEDAFGWGISASGRVKAGARDDIRFNVVAGEGLGRYVGLNATNAAAVNPIDGSLEAIPSVGGLVAWRHPFGETARLNIGYSGLWIDNPDFLPGSVTKEVYSAFGALLWDVAPKTTVGAEIMFGQRENEAGASGDMTRFTVSTKYAF